MENNIKNTFNFFFENYKNLENCKEIIKDRFKEYESYKKDQDQNSLLNHIITKTIRNLYQENLSKNFELKSDECKKFGINVMTFLVWMSDNDLIDYSSYLVIVEDIIDTFPIKDLEKVFIILEKNLNTKIYSNFTDNRKLTLLKISSSILKRLSSSNDTKFRGRVQMVLASIFPISDKSGVNQKGLYNLNNLGNQSKFEKSKIINYPFYKQFWIVLKYMANPFTLFSSQITNEEVEDLQFLDNELNETQIISLEEGLHTSKIEIFLNNISKIILYLQNHQIDLNENSDTILSYPKYLTNQDLFDLQLNDSSFRITIFTQFFIVLRSFLRPVSQTQKKSFVFSENEKKKINELLIQIKINLKRSRIYSKLKKIFKEEESWETWKESGCPTYEKFPGEDLKMNIAKKVEFKKEIESAYRNIKSKNLFKIDNLANYDFNKNFDINLNDLKDIKYNFSYMESLNSENPFLGNYIERVLKDNDPQMEIDESDSIINNDETFSWKLLRLISINDISRLNNESNISSIIKEYAEKYGKSVMKFSIREPLTPNHLNTYNITQNSHSDNIMEEIEQAKEQSYKIDKEKYTKRKRSIDKSETTYSDQFKKKKLGHN